MSVANAQDTLFPYPVAPDTCSTLESRCDFIVIHFWDNFDLSKPIRDEQAFANAFADYVDFFKYADRSIVISAIRSFMFKAQANSGNFVKIGDVAERTLYGEDAVYWSDDAYLPFAQALADSKQVKKEIRAHYAEQINKIQKNQMEQDIPLTEWTGADGSKHSISEVSASEIIILLITDDGMDSDMARLRLSTDVNLNDMIAHGEVAVIDLTMGKYSGNWAAKAKSYPDNWIVGTSNDIKKLLDVRIVPGAYILSKDKKILNKNVSVESIKQAFSN